MNDIYVPGRRPQLTRVPSVPSVLFAYVDDVHDAFAVEASSSFAVS